MRRLLWIMGLWGAVAVAAMTVPTAIAQTQDEEIKALREEVKALRMIVNELIETQASNQQLDDQSISDRLVPTPSYESEKPSLSLKPMEGSDGGFNGSFPTRQPLGRFPDDAFVTAGRFARSISVPGTNGAFRIGGAVQVNANFDTDNLGFQQIGTPPTIPLDDSVDDGDQQSALHVRHSRVNFDYRAPTEYGQFRTFVEFDFFGDGDEFTNDFDLRLRHAAAEWGRWKVGQFWSGFVDVFSFPETADPGGPLAAPVLRNPGIYYVRGGREQTNWGLGIENPAADLGGRTELIASEEIPTLVAFSRIQRDWGYVRVAALGLQLKSASDSDYTGGIHLSGRLNTPFTGSDQNNLSFATQYGEGFVHYFSSFVGELDGVVSDIGEIEATGVFGAFLGYQHFWTNRWRSTITASVFDLDPPGGALPLSYASGERFSANLFYTANENVTFGFEGIYNTIETVDDSSGDGLRIEFVGRYDF